jgi:hypothetical protein
MFRKGLHKTASSSGNHSPPEAATVVRWGSPQQRSTSACVVIPSFMVRIEMFMVFISGLTIS